MENQIKLKLNRENIGNNEKLPIKVLQFGEGNFLRAFVEYAFYTLNKELNFNAGIAVVQPLENGMVQMIEDQDGLYTLFLNGIKNGEKIQDIYLIDNIVEYINPYKQFNEFLEIAKLASLEFVISNTTEAGIEFINSDTITMQPPKAFPARLALFLYQRFKHFNGNLTKGLAIIPCELINYNGDTLKNILLEYCTLWQLEGEFKSWLQNACTFHNTLVDRIVPGYPRNEIEEYNNKLDYEDNILVTAEPFFLWVIEGDEKLKEKLPFHKTNLEVKIVKDMQPYRTRKVRILNGIHTAMVPFSILFGNETVQQTIDNPFTAEFITKMGYEEIIPTLDMDKEELKKFTNEVFDRFRNPFIKHQLSDIALNSIAKFKVRVLPSIKNYIEMQQKMPINLVFGFACLIRFYQGTWNGVDLPLKDNEEIKTTFQAIWEDNNLQNIANKTLSNEEFWGEDLNKISGLNNAIVVALTEIEKNGITEAYRNFAKQFS